MLWIVLSIRLFQRWMNLYLDSKGDDIVIKKKKEKRKKKKEKRKNNPLYIAVHNGDYFFLISKN